MDFLKGCILVNYDVFCEQCGCKELFAITHTLKNRLNVAGQSGKHRICAAFHIRQLLQDLRVAAAYLYRDLRRILRNAAVHGLQLCLHRLCLGIQRLNQSVIVLAVLLCERSIDPVQNAKKLLLIFSRFGSDRFDQCLQLAMRGIHIRVDLRKSRIDPGEALHDLIHAQAVRSSHIGKHLLNFSLCCGNIRMYLIQLSGKEADLFIDVLIGLLIPGCIFRLRLLMPQLIRRFQIGKQSGKLFLRLTDQLRKSGVHSCPI